MNDTLYCHGVDSILQRCLTHEDVEIILNGCHSGDYGGHLFRLATPQKILHTEYFWPLIFKECIETVKKFPPCQMFTTKKNTHPSLLHRVVTAGPFFKCGIEFLNCLPTSAKGHVYIIVAMDYFTKWVEAMPTYAEDGKTTTLFLFNHIITRFGISRAIMTNHGSHF